MNGSVLCRPWRQKLVSLRLFWSLTGSRLIEKRCAVKYKHRKKVQIYTFLYFKKHKKGFPRGMLPKGKALFLYEIADYAGKFSALYRRSSAFAACLH
jgi:hypothetical protein